jgi:hypothetical protein
MRRLMTSWRARGIVVVVIFLVAGAAYGLFGATTQINRNEMARLVVDQTHLPGFEVKPYLDQPQNLSSVPSKILAEAAARDPAKTGVYSRGWRNTSSSGTAGFLIELLPTASEAKKQKETLQEGYAIKKDYSAAGLTLVGPFDVPGIPGVFAREFTVAASQGSPATTVDFVIFQVGRVAVSLGVQDANSSRQGTVQLATAEMHLLRQEEPGFSMTSSAHEPITALWFGLGALAVSLVVVGVPAAIVHRRRRRERQAVKARRQEQRHVTSRGGKVLRRRGVPAWQARPTSRRRSRVRSRR